MNKILKHYKEAYSGLPREAWLLASVVLINRSGSMVLFFMSLYFTKKLGFEVSTAGKLVSMYGLGSLIGSYIGGLLSDMIGPKRVQLLSLFFSGVGYIFLGTLTTLNSIAITLLILAIVTDAFRPANMTAMAEVCNGKNRARGFALNRLAMSIGLAIGPAVGGFLATLDYGYLFWVDGLTCILAGVFFLLIFRKSLRAIGTESYRNDKVVHSPWKDSVFLGLLGLLLIIGIVFFQIFNTWPLYLKEKYGLIENQFGFLLTLNCFMIILIEMVLIHLLEKKNILRVTSLGALLIFTGFFLLPYGDNYAYVIFTLIIWTLGEILVFPLTATFISNRATDENRGKYMGMFTFTFSTSFVIGPMAGAWIYDTYGPSFLWNGVGLVGLGVFIGFLWLERIVNGRRSDARLKNNHSIQNSGINQELEGN